MICKFKVILQWINFLEGIFPLIWTKYLYPVLIFALQNAHESKIFIYKSWLLRSWEYFQISWKCERYVQKGKKYSYINDFILYLELQSIYLKKYIFLGVEWHTTVAKFLEVWHSPNNFKWLVLQKGCKICLLYKMFRENYLEIFRCTQFFGKRSW